MATAITIALPHYAVKVVYGLGSRKEKDSALRTAGAAAVAELVMGRCSVERCQALRENAVPSTTTGTANKLIFCD